MKFSIKVSVIVLFTMVLFSCRDFQLSQQIEVENNTKEKILNKIMSVHNLSTIYGFNNTGIYKSIPLKKLYSVSRNTRYLPPFGHSSFDYQLDLEGLNLSLPDSEYNVYVGKINRTSEEKKWCFLNKKSKSYFYNNKFTIAINPQKELLFLSPNFTVRHDWESFFDLNIKNPKTYYDFLKVRYAHIFRFISLKYLRISEEGEYEFQGTIIHHNPAYENAPYEIRIWCERGSQPKSHYSIPNSEFKSIYVDTCVGFNSFSDKKDYLFDALMRNIVTYKIGNNINVEEVLNINKETVFFNLELKLINDTIIPRYSEGYFNQIFIPIIPFNRKAELTFLRYWKRPPVHMKPEKGSMMYGIKHVVEKNEEVEIYPVLLKKNAIALEKRNSSNSKAFFMEVESPLFNRENPKLDSFDIYLLALNTINGDVDFISGDNIYLSNVSRLYHEENQTFSESRIDIQLMYLRDRLIKYLPERITKENVTYWDEKKLVIEFFGRKASKQERIEATLYYDNPEEVEVLLID